jgi:hypothetical protein
MLGIFHFAIQMDGQCLFKDVLLIGQPRHLVELDGANEEIKMVTTSTFLIQLGSYIRSPVKKSIRLKSESTQ